MPPLPKAGAQLDLDSSQWDAAFKGAMADAAKLDALDPTVKINVTDADLKTAIGLANDLNTNTSMKANVDDSEIDSAKEKLDDIATIGAIDLAINIAGNAQSFVEGLGRFSGVGGILEMDSALALIQARTGKMIPDAEKLINDLYTNGWGASRTEIAAVVAQASQLGFEGADLEAAVLSTLQVVSVTGGEATETLNKLDTAAKANGISFTNAADLFVTGYQNGGDKADDLLDTLSEYGTTFSNFRLSAEGALAILDSGLANGVFNSDVLADSVRELGIRLASIGTDENVTKAFEDLDKLSDVDLAGLLDGYEAGKITGDEMLQGIIDAIGDVAEVDPSKATTLGAQIVGTQLEDMGVSVFSKLTTDADAAFGEMEGRAAEAGNAISDTLAVTVDTFLREVEQMAVDLLSSDAIDLDGKIEAFKTQLQAAAATIAEGGSIGDALSVGFHIEGVDAALANVERVFGQFVLSILEIVAVIQDPLNNSDKDDGTRAEIARLATRQLPFDIKIANPEELDGIITQALSRGVTAPDAIAGLTTALDEVIAESDFSKAIDIITAIENAEGVTPETIAFFKNKYITPLGTAMDESVASGEFDIAKKIADAQDDPTAFTDAIKGKFGFDAAAFDQMAADFATGMETAIAAETPTPDMLWADLWKVPDDVTTSIKTFETDVDTAMENAALVTGLSSESMLLALAAMSDGVVTADEEIALAITGNTMTSSFDAMSASADQNAQATKASFQSILATVASVDGSMSTFFNSIMAKVTAVNSAIETISTVPTGAGGSVTNNNINVSQTNNVQGNAQAQAAGYQLGNAVRGFA